jgi:hypothetical protein
VWKDSLQTDRKGVELVQRWLQFTKALELVYTGMVHCENFKFGLWAVHTFLAEVHSIKACTVENVGRNFNN